MSYDQEYRELLEAFKKAGIYAGSVTHLPRKVHSRFLGDQGVPDYQIGHLGLWEMLNVMLERYLNGLPWHAILAAAGFHGDDWRVYGLHRNREPPAVLEAKIFEFAADALATLNGLPADANVHAKVTTKCQLDLLMWLRKVILQVRSEEEGVVGC